MADLCHQHGCGNRQTKACSACGDAYYCCINCQKKDWKVHKLLCVDMAKLTKSILGVEEVNKLVIKISDRAETLGGEKKIAKAIRVLEKCLIFVQYQYGPHVPGKSYCIRPNGDRVDNLTVCSIRVILTHFYERSLIATKKKPLVLSNAIEARQLLVLRRNEGKDLELPLLVQCELSLGFFYTRNGPLEKAAYHCEESLNAAKEYRGLEKVSYISQSLIYLSRVRLKQDRSSDALQLAEDAYIMLSENNGPVHPSVQVAGGQIIQCLMALKEYSRADNYARINYENLIDPLNGIDFQSEAVSDGMKQLAMIWVNKSSTDYFSETEHNDDNENDNKNENEKEYNNNNNDYRNKCKKEYKKNLKDYCDAGFEAKCFMENACCNIEILFGANSIKLGEYLQTYSEVLIKLDESKIKIKMILQHILEIFLEHFHPNSEQSMEARENLENFMLKCKFE